MMLFWWGKQPILGCWCVLFSVCAILPEYEPIFTKLLSAVTKYVLVATTDFQGNKIVPSSNSQCSMLVIEGSHLFGAFGGLEGGGNARCTGGRIPTAVL
jgi:hypothetical protein